MKKDVGLKRFQPQLRSPNNLKQQLHYILALRLPCWAKKNLLEGFASIIKQSLKNETGKVVDHLSTALSDSSSDQGALLAEIEELQFKILERRYSKFKINQEIESAEENFYRIQKMVEEMKEKDEALTKQIDRSMQEIQKCPNPEPEKSYLNKGIETVSGIFLSGCIEF